MNATFDRHRAAIRTRLRDTAAVRPGPGSVSWRINGEVIVLVAWGRAILLQLAHPLIATAVAEHSSFRRSGLAGVQRLISTVRAMLAITFGADDEAIDAAAGINAIHDHVAGRLGASTKRLDADARYSAHDPELLRWVHVTLIDSIMIAYERLVAPLSTADRDRYCAESAIMEPLLGMPHGWLPRTSAQLAQRTDEGLRGVVDPGPRSRELARAVLFPPGWRLAWPAFRAAQVMTTGLLPPAVRDAYGFAWTDGDARALVRWARILRRVRRALPRPLREWPAAWRTSRSAAPSDLDHTRAAVTSAAPPHSLSAER
ncbi:MAG: DUF2236 domain-containing protein [Acidobacteria bacterium]|nr:DUF2236 domain-containing protein [Acidobacteriota bacterium]